MNIRPEFLKRQRTYAKVFCLFVFPIAALLIEATNAWNDWSQAKAFNWLNLAATIGMVVWGFVVYLVSMAIFRFVEGISSNEPRK
ncbi:MAG: hypothetical protein ACKOQM_09650 [Novosphingobium sp.]